MENTYNVIKSVPTTLSSIFLDDKNIPMEFKNSPRWRIVDYDFNTVLTGYGVQNPNHPEEWLAYFTIPDTAPVDIDKKYRIMWDVNINGKEYKNTEVFTVIEQGEPVALDSSVFMLLTDKFKDDLLVSEQPSNLKIEVVSDDDRVVYESSDSSQFTISRFNGSYRVCFNSNSVLTQLKDYGIGFYPYLIKWTYDLPTRPSNVEFHTLYIGSAKAVIYIDAMKRYMDKARNYDINPNLRWTDAELSHFLLVGLARINTYPPTMTYWTLNTLPQPLFYLLLKCAEVEALNALYLAEGFSAFDFQGASTTLQVDRTQYISYKIDEINSWISENLKEIKRNIVRASGAGVLSVTITPSTNNVVRVSNSFILNRLIRIHPLL